MFIFFIHLVFTIGCSLFFWMKYKPTEPFVGKRILVLLESSPRHLSEFPWFLLFFSFILFLLLPLSFGLSLYLKSDANVLVVILWIVWSYNWCKYSFWRE